MNLIIFFKRSAKEIGEKMEVEMEAKDKVLVMKGSNITKVIRYAIIVELEYFTDLLLIRVRIDEGSLYETKRLLLKEKADELYNAILDNMCMYP